MVTNISVKVVIADRFRDKIKAMPIQGIQQITKLLVGEELTANLFEARIFKNETRAIQRENVLRSKESMSAYTMMLAAPRDVLDRHKIPDVFRRDISTQSHRRVERYKKLLSSDIIQDFGSFMVEHTMERATPTQIGLKCVHITRLFDDQGNLIK